MQDTTLQTDSILVRTLRPDDLESVIRLDSKIVGKRREEYFKTKLAQNLAETGIKVSLAAEIDGCFCGFLLCRLFYGEFGVPEPVAVLDTFGVDPLFGGRGVGHELIAQLRMHLTGVGVTQLRSEVQWSDLELIGFFQREGFVPAPRICLDLDL